MADYDLRRAELMIGRKNSIDIDSPLRKQLKHFYNSLLLHGMKKSRCPDNWMDAFLMLEMFLQSIDDGSRQLIFIDELPWLDTPKSGFITIFFRNDRILRHRQALLAEEVSPKIAIHSTLITTYGLKYNEYSGKSRGKENGNN